jgi:hypothetical protein
MKFKINQKIKQFKPVKIELELDSIDEVMSLYAQLNRFPDKDDFPDQWNSGIHKEESFGTLWDKLDNIITNHFESKN